jgi:3-phenylpropionate/cinnamic acid dioxygenase small subunit
MTLDDLLAREGIRDLVTRYNSYGDSGRFEPLWDLFAEHAVMEVGPDGGDRTTYDGRESIKAIFTGAQARVKAQLDNARPTYVRHMTATHQIDLVDADHATGRCYFAVLMDQGLDHWGRYIDRYVRIDGAWRFEHRRVYVDGTSGDSWFAS